MLQKYFARCETCEEKFVLRIGVGHAAVQPVVFACPHCNSSLRGVLSVDYKNIVAKLESSDCLFFSCGRESKEPDKGVNLYTDVPVPVECQGRSLVEGGSAFMALMPRLGIYLEDLSIQKDMMQHFVHDFLPAVRRSSSLYLNENWKPLRKQLAKIEMIDGDKPVPVPQISFGFNETLLTMLIPISSGYCVGYRFNFFLKLFKDLRSNDGKNLRQLIDTYYNEFNFNLFKKQTIETIIKCFEHYDAIVAGLYYEYILLNTDGNCGKLQIFRDDFQLLKSLYIDIYELSMKSLSFIGPIFNLYYRNDCKKWSNGECYSLKKFGKLKAHEKEFVFMNDMNLCDNYNMLDRKIRNKIGHNSISYDFLSSKLVAENGYEINVLDFIKSYSMATRILHILHLIQWMISENQYYKIKTT